MAPFIDPDLIGEAWPAARPFEDPSIYGAAVLEPDGPREARSLVSLKLIYTAGRYGIDDSGALRVSFRMVGDWNGLQTEDPTAANYVSASTTGRARLALEYRSGGLSPRPRNKSLTVRVSGGFLGEGETISLTFGDTSRGSPGLRLQTFAEPGFEFKVSVDPCAVGHFVPLPVNPEIAIVPGPPAAWRAALPGLRRPGEEFRLGLRADDQWGNPTDQAEGRFELRASLPVAGLPEVVDFPRGEKSLILGGLSVAEEGVLRVKVKDEAGRTVAESNPLVIRTGEVAGYWGDLHGQTGETVGISAAREYFTFARDIAFLDVTSHQGNDFQMTKAFWAYLNTLTAEFQTDGRFIALPGYEWSGNTGVGGDRNIFFRREGRQIRRSSHALLTDVSDIDTDAQDGRKLFRDLAGEDVLAYAHVGGRPANVDFAHDPTIETAMEIHSAWGTFEWLMDDCFRLGHRVGVVANSDDHKGRPGASHPGASTFGAFGGLTCFLTDELTRDGIFRALRQRRHFATTGPRIHLDVRAGLREDSVVFDRDPKAFPRAGSRPAAEALMGDIVRTGADSVTLRLEAITHSGIDRIEIRNGSEVLQTVRGCQAADTGSRVRVIWTGAEYRGRGRETMWTGRAVFAGATVRDWRPINAWNVERLFEARGDDSLVWEAVTTGNLGGFEAWLDEGPEARYAVETNLGTLSGDLAGLALEGRRLDCGGLGRGLAICRLPDEPLTREMELETAIDLKAQGDNPLWVCLSMEDGSQAWSSPIYVFRD